MWSVNHVCPEGVPKEVPEEVPEGVAEGMDIVLTESEKSCRTVDKLTETSNYSASVAYLGNIARANASKSSALGNSNYNFI
jgi:hypothetical protein